MAKNLLTYKDSKMKNTEVKLRALAARNFAWALPSQKGTVK
jgi:hypothetical protein